MKAQKIRSLLALIMLAVVLFVGSVTPVSAARNGERWSHGNGEQSSHAGCDVPKCKRF